MHPTNKKLIALLAVILFASIGITYAVVRTQRVPPEPAGNYPQFHEADLAPFNGTNPDKPIYIGLDGYVYDVSAGGKQFYVTGASYHYLAGRDSSKELDLIGGEIIKRKYPIVGVLVK